MSLITLTNPTSATAEAYRTLRTNLHFAALETPLKTMVVAAPDSPEQGAIALANLAITLAQSGKRVICVDANLRQPQLHTLFNANNDKGFVDMLRDGRASALQATNVANLSLVPAGKTPDIPSDVIASLKMGATIQALASLTDVVLFNTPPVAMVSDAAILSSLVDGVVLVITAGKTHREQAQQAKDILQRAKARLLGAVVLGV